MLSKIAINNAVHKNYEIKKELKFTLQIRTIRFSAEV
jgi:hypothetical protein